MLNLGLILNKLMERLKIQGNSLHYVGGNDVLPPPLSKYLRKRRKSFF